MVDLSIVFCKRLPEGTYYYQFAWDEHPTNPAIFFWASRGTRVLTHSQYPELVTGKMKHVNFSLRMGN